MRPSRDNTAEFLQKLTPYVDSDGGRNLNRISHSLSIPYQTLRFRMMHLKDEGIGVLPVVDTAKLGLEKVRVSFKLSPSMKEKPFFGGLHQSAGLRYYCRGMLTGVLDTEFNIPGRSLGELRSLLQKLEELKIIQSVKVRRLIWKDILMLKTEFFDYSKAEWDVDFSSLAGDPSVKIPPISSPVHFDYTDLLIIKELELDPWVKIVDLAKKMNSLDREVAYHLNKHVFGNSLISSFRFRWVGTKDAWSKHSIIGTTFFFNEISNEKARHAMSVLTSTPFTWSHMRGEDGTYIVEALYPISQFSETTQYISSKLRALDLYPEVAIPDWSCVSSYTIPYMLYNADSAKWELEAERALEYVLQMVKTYST